MLKLKIPPPVYMLLMAVLMWLLDRVLPIIELIHTPWNKLGFLPIIFALFADGMSLMQFFRSHTTVNPMHPEKAATLVTTGMYQITRNPMYVGLLLLLIGWAFLLGSFSPFFMLPVFIVVITSQQITPEEKSLEENFGQQYLDYKKMVKTLVLKIPVIIQDVCFIVLLVSGLARQIVDVIVVLLLNNLTQLARSIWVLENMHLE